MEEFDKPVEGEDSAKEPSFLKKELKDLSKPAVTLLSIAVLALGFSISASGVRLVTNNQTAAVVKSATSASLSSYIVTPFVTPSFGCKGTDAAGFVSTLQDSLEPMGTGKCYGKADYCMRVKSSSSNPPVIIAQLPTIVVASKSGQSVGDESFCSMDGTESQTKCGHKYSVDGNVSTSMYCPKVYPKEGPDESCKSLATDSYGCCSDIASYESISQAPEGSKDSYVFTPSKLCCTAGKTKCQVNLVTRGGIVVNNSTGQTVMTWPQGEACAYQKTKTDVLIPQLNRTLSNAACDGSFFPETNINTAYVEPPHQGKYNPGYILGINTSAIGANVKKQNMLAQVSSALSSNLSIVRTNRCEFRLNDSTINDFSELYVKNGLVFIQGILYPQFEQRANSDIDSMGVSDEYKMVLRLAYDDLVLSGGQVKYYGGTWKDSGISPDQMSSFTAIYNNVISQSAKDNCGASMTLPVARFDKLARDTKSVTFTAPTGTVTAGTKTVYVSWTSTYTGNEMGKLYLYDASNTPVPDPYQGWGGAGSIDIQLKTIPLGTYSLALNSKLLSGTYKFVVIGNTDGARYESSTFTVKSTVVPPVISTKSVKFTAPTGTVIAGKTVSVAWNSTNYTNTDRGSLYLYNADTNLPVSKPYQDSVSTNLDSWSMYMKTLAQGAFNPTLKSTLPSGNYKFVLISTTGERYDQNPSFSLQSAVTPSAPPAPAKDVVASTPSPDSKTTTSAPDEKAVVNTPAPTPAISVIVPSSAGHSYAKGDTLDIQWKATPDVAEVSIIWTKIGADGGAEKTGWVTVPTESNWEATPDSSSYHGITNPGFLHWTIPAWLHNGTYIIQIFKTDHTFPTTGVVSNPTVMGGSAQFEVTSPVSFNPFRWLGTVFLGWK